ncbi:hypothetical protein [Streptacidiphilus melanogenes]|uniref:hypothetical protein n=1 Tax=Streptacidiphilus melanogenes TaxID=411235 RepID=UPI0006936446|nr:hypothetical protein [Streptacidiphilus melanogenes]
MPLVMPKRARLAVVGIAVAGTLLAGGPAFAASGGTASPAAQAPKGDGAHALCLRVPKLQRRIERDLTRLAGGQNVRGSVARLEARVANAKKLDHTAIATYLQDRLNTREALVGTLKQRQTDLQGVQAWCGANDNGKGAK